MKFGIDIELNEKGRRLSDVESNLKSLGNNVDIANKNLAIATENFNKLSEAAAIAGEKAKQMGSSGAEGANDAAIAYEKAADEATKAGQAMAEAGVKAKKAAADHELLGVANDKNRESMGSLISVIGQAASAYIGFSVILGQFKSSITSAGNMEGMKIGISALIASNSANVDSLGNSISAMEKFNMAQNDATRVMGLLRKANIETAATLPQLAEGFQSALGPAQRVGFTLDQTVKYVTGMTQAAAALNIPMNQLSQEMRSVFEGDMSKDSRINSTITKMTTATIEQHRVAGDLFKFLMDKLKDFDAAGKATMKSWAGVTSDLSDSWTEFKVNLVETSGVFQLIKDGLSGISDVIKNNNNEYAVTNEIVKTIVVALGTLATAITVAKLAQLGFNSAVLKNPYILGITAAVAGFTAMSSVIDSVRKKKDDFFATNSNKESANFIGKFKNSLDGKDATQQVSLINERMKALKSEQLLVAQKYKDSSFFNKSQNDQLGQQNATIKKTYDELSKLKSAYKETAKGSGVFVKTGVLVTDTKDSDYANKQSKLKTDAQYLEDIGKKYESERLLLSHKINEMRKNGIEELRIAEVSKYGFKKIDDEELEDKKSHIDKIKSARDKANRDALKDKKESLQSKIEYYTKTGDLRKADEYKLKLNYLELLNTHKLKGAELANYLKSGNAEIDKKEEERNKKKIKDLAKAEDDKLKLQLKYAEDTADIEKASSIKKSIAANDINSKDYSPDEKIRMIAAANNKIDEETSKSIAKISASYAQALTVYEDFYKSVKDYENLLIVGTAKINNEVDSLDLLDEQKIALKTIRIDEFSKAVKNLESEDVNKTLNSQLKYFEEIKDFASEATVKIKLYYESLKNAGYDKSSNTGYSDSQKAEMVNAEIIRINAEAQDKIDEKSLATLKDKIKYLELTKQYSEALLLDAQVFDIENRKSTLNQKELTEIKLNDQEKIADGYNKIKIAELEASQSFSDVFKAFMIKQKSELENYASYAKEILGSVESALNKGYTDFFDSTSKKFKDLKELGKSVLQDVLKDIQAMAIKALSKQTMQLFSGITGQADKPVSIDSSIVALDNASVAATKAAAAATDAATAATNVVAKVAEKGGVVAPLNTNNTDVKANNEVLSAATDVATSANKAATAATDAATAATKLSISKSDVLTNDTGAKIVPITSNDLDIQETKAANLNANLITTTIDSSSLSLGEKLSAAFKEAIDDLKKTMMMIVSKMGSGKSKNLWDVSSKQTSNAWDYSSKDIGQTSTTGESQSNASDQSTTTFQDAANNANVADYAFNNATQDNTSAIEKNTTEVLSSTDASSSWTESVSQWSSGLGGWASGLMSTVSGWLGSFTSYVGQGFSQLISSLAGKLSEWATNIMTKITGSSKAGGMLGQVVQMGIQYITGGGAFANGGVFQGGSLQKFATGTVITSPTYFGMSSNQTGLMGEAGPEAIMPLQRGSNGKLGITMHSSDSIARQIGSIINIHNYTGHNINTTKNPDGSTDIDIGKIDKMLAARITSGRSIMDKVTANKYAINKR
jgi:hypothetical protein